MGILIASFSNQSQTSPKAVGNNTVTWLTWEQAMEKMKKEPRKIVVDVYTDWCGWCKVMDKQTFTNDTIAEYLNKHFYCVKFDAEGQETIRFDGKEFVWISPEKSGARNGIHTLAYALLDGQLSYPTLVYLNEKYERIGIFPGYKTPERLLPELRYSAEEVYKAKSYQDFAKTLPSPQGGN
jgi:thioredoxin-related protein